jgi:hypothetical protein
MREKNLFINDFPAWHTRTVWNFRKRDFPEDGIAISSHKPIQQIAYGLN